MAFSSSTNGLKTETTVTPTKLEVQTSLINGSQSVTWCRTGQFTSLLLSGSAWIKNYSHSNVLFLILCQQKSTVSTSRELPVHNILCLIFITKEIVKWRAVISTESSLWVASHFPQQTAQIYSDIPDVLRWILAKQSKHNFAGWNQ